MKELKEIEQMLQKIANRLYNLVMECDEMIDRIIKLEELEELKDGRENDMLDK